MNDFRVVKLNSDSLKRATIRSFCNSTILGTPNNDRRRLTLEDDKKTEF